MLGKQKKAPPKRGQNWSGQKELNFRLRPWKGEALTLGYAHAVSRRGLL
jgi:hypothetical protein